MSQPGRPSQLTLSFVQEKPAPGRPGGAELEEHNDTQFIEMTCRSVLNWVQGSRASDFYSVNPYRGCEFGCAYCYARYTHEYLDRPDWRDFERKIFVKVNAPEVFAHELRKKQVLEHGISFGSATDPYQPAERRFRLTRRMLEKLLPLRGIPVSIVTKSGLIEQDADLLAELATRHDVKVLFSCVTLDARLQRVLEPRAHVPARRFAAMEALTSRGVRCGLLVAPILPGITDDETDLVALLRRARAAGASSMMAQVLFLPAASRRRFFPWLQEHHPELYDRYAKAFKSGREFESGYRQVVAERLERARQMSGFEAEMEHAVR